MEKNILMVLWILTFLLLALKFFLHVKSSFNGRSRTVFALTLFSKFFSFKYLFPVKNTANKRDVTIINCLIYLFYLMLMLSSALTIFFARKGIIDAG
jgi:hypothetical protein